MLDNARGERGKGLFIKAREGVRTKEHVVHRIGRDDVSSDSKMRIIFEMADNITTYLTGPSASIVFLVSSVSGVEAMSQTSPVASLTAVERPPKGKMPKRLNGLSRAVSS